MRWTEGLRMALEAIRANKLRSSLTLVGIIAGVASIIAVMTGISVIQSTMESELSILGTTTFQVQKWPARGGFQGDVDWEAIRKRKPVTVGNADAIRDKVSTIDLVGPELWHFGAMAQYKGEKTEPRLTICGGTPEYAPNNTHWVEFGRNLSRQDMRIARSVVVIGYSLAEQLFPFTDPIEKMIKVDGHKFRVIGIFGEKKSEMGGNYDNYILMPINVFERRYGTRRGTEPRSVNVTVNAKSPELVPSAIEEVRAVLRADRGVDPRADDDFTIFTNDSMIRSFNQSTRNLKIAAFVIGIIALLVAGIGIMNIMLVSVTERTHEIGIRKALGAKRKNILLQFLLEAILLCNIGGVLGVALGFGLGNIVAIQANFPINIPMNWAVIGLVFCTSVGLTFGLWPAIKASRLAPIEALRYE